MGYFGEFNEYFFGDWGVGVGGIGTMSKTKLKRIDTLKYHKCAVKKIVYEVVG